MQQSERLRFARHLRNHGLTIEEIKTAIEMVELTPLSKENWNEIIEFIKD